MGNLIIKKRKEQETKKVRDSQRAIQERRLADAKRKAEEEVKKLADAEGDDDEMDNEVDLTPEDIAELKALLPYKEALIKIAKGEFEIERIVEEDDEDEVIEEDDEDEVIEEDETEVDEDVEVDEDLEEDNLEDLGDSTIPGAMEDSEEINDAWRKRLNGSK
jgi:hypothetical protein